MKKTLSGVLLLAFLSVGFQTGGNNVPEVEIVLDDGAVVTGQILALRDTSIVCWMDVTNGKESIVVLPHNRILNLQTVGNSNIVLGLFAGCTVGLLAGCAIGGSQDVQEGKDDWTGCTGAVERGANQTAGAAVGSLVGSALGLIVGGATSNASEVLISPARRDFKVLKQVARYPDSEPEYLKSVAP
jgi:hypothetical protein